MENKNYSTKGIIEASLISVIISVIIVITGYVPILSIAIEVLILPIPIAILYIRHNIKLTISAIFFSIVFTSLLYNPIMAIYAALTYSFMGIALGYCVRENKKSSITLVVLSVVSAISNILTVAFSLLFIEKTTLMNFIFKSLDIYKSAMQGSLEQLKAFYLQNGITPNQVKTLEESFEMLKNIDFSVVLAMIPTTLLIIAVVSAWLTYKISRSILKKLNYKLPELASFSMLCVNNIIGAVTIGTVCIGIILASKNIIGGDFLQESSQMMGQLIFTVNGLAATTYFLRKKIKLSKPVILLLLVIILLSPLGTIYFSIGIVEMAFDFRKLDPYRIKRK